MAISWVEPRAWAKKKRGAIPRPVWGEWAAWYLVGAIWFVITEIVEPLISRRPLEDAGTLLGLAISWIVVLIPAPWFSRWFAKGVVNITREGVRYEFADFKGSAVLIPWGGVGSYAVTEEGEHRVFVLRGLDGEELQRYALAPKVDQKELEKTIGWYRNDLKRQVSEAAMIWTPPAG